MGKAYIFGMHWMHRRAVFYDEVTAASTAEARDYFNRYKRDDVALIRVELIGSAGAGNEQALLRAPQQVSLSSLGAE
jgi:hypothetical protein